MKTSNAYYIWFLMIFNDISRLHCNLYRTRPLTEDMPKHGFGKYVIDMSELRECPSISDTIDKDAFIDYDLKPVKVNETDQEVFGQIYMPKTVKCVKGRLTPFLIKRDGTLSRTLNKTSHDPCNDLILSMPLKLILSLDKNCNFKQGNYTIEKFNLNQFGHSIAGDNFIFGRAVLTIEYFSKSGLVFCTFATVDIKRFPKINKGKKTHKKRN